MARPKLIIASSEANADMLYASGFRAPDAFSYLQVEGKSLLLLSDLEVDRGRADAKVDVVDAYSDFEKWSLGLPRNVPHSPKSSWLG